MTSGLQFFSTYFRLVAGNFVSFFTRLDRAVDRAHLSYCPPWVTLDRAIAFTLCLFAAFMVIDPLVASLPKVLPVEALHLFGTLTKLGSSRWYIIPPAIFLVLLLFVDWRNLSRRALLATDRIVWQAGAILIAVAGSGLSVNIIKRMIGRARPRLFEEAGSFHFDPFAFKSLYASFPSGHATTMGAMLVIGLIYLPKWRFTLIAAALLIAFTRVVIGSHYLSDIMMGLAFGATFTWIVVVYFARRGKGYTITDHGDSTIAPQNPFERAPFPVVFKDVLAQLSIKQPEELQGSVIASKRPLNEETTNNNGSNV